MFNNFLFIIPARGGSKGVPKKNIKLFLGKPLIYYSVEYARLFVPDENICLSTDDLSIIELVNEINLKAQFVRPLNLASDTADTFSVLVHAYNYFKKSFNKEYKGIILLQPTSPLRVEKHLLEAINLFTENTEMVVSVCEAKSSPYFTIFEEDGGGFLQICKGDNSYSRRQDAPTTYEYNGSIYIINSNVLDQKKSFKEITKKVKYKMSDYYSIDIDTEDDWDYAEFKYSKQLCKK